MLVELPGYVSGKLDADSAAPVRAHLQTCAACRDELIQIQRLDKLLKEALPTIAPSPGFASKFANRLAAEVAAEEHALAGGWAGWLLQPWLVGLAATAMLAFIVLGVLRSSNSPRSFDTSIPKIPSLSGAVAQKSVGESPKLASNTPEKDKAIASNVPSDVLQRPQLFVDYSVIRDLDLLESGTGDTESHAG
jgi:predicted anti-sigma-YlaC factor YlaD